jgi:2-C-methyl-D-erythritol 4-phosphate cytidylyltransferase
MAATHHFAIVPSAGSSSRMGKNQSKLLLPLEGRPIITRTVETLLSVAEIGHVIVVLPQAGKEQFAEVLAHLGDRVAFVPGGKVRQESVWLALQYARRSNMAGEQTIAVIHDGARCLATADLIRRTLAAALIHGAAIAAVPAVDSMKQVDAAGAIVRSLDRSALWQAQTPQAFRFSLLWEAHERAPGTATDDAALVEPIHPVQIVAGEKINFKITTPEDYQFALALAAAGSV